MWFGKHKGKKLESIPNDYFFYLLEKKIAFKGIKKYAKERLYKSHCGCGAMYDGIQCNKCGFDASEIDI